MVLQMAGLRMVGSDSTFAWTLLMLCLGIYKFYAVDVLTLADKPGFPILIDGHYADNDNSRYKSRASVLSSWLTGVDTSLEEPCCNGPPWP